MMNASKRYMISVVSGVLLTGIAIISVLYRLEGVAMTCIGGVMTILTTYIWAETKRPSKKE
jgi:hypothetical protein